VRRLIFVMLVAGSAIAQLRLTNGPQGTSPKTIRAVLGRTNLETPRSGSVETLPLSSLVLFDKEGKVLWKRCGGFC